MDFKLANLASDGLKPLKNDLGLSLHQLSKWNKHLDNERLKTLHAQEDLKKQQKTSKINSVQLKNQVLSIEQQAVLIASQLEEQKTKHEHLLILVKKAEQQIYQEKLDKHIDVINKKEPDEFEEHKKILAEHEKKLEKILQKLNSSEFQISKKVDVIRSLRSQRAIHSNVLDKLEKQIFQVNFYYKQLLLERTLIEKKLQRYSAEFNNIYQKSSLEMSRLKKSQNLQKQSRIEASNVNLADQPKKQFFEKKAKNPSRMNELSFRGKEGCSSDKPKSKNELAMGSKIMDQKNLDQIRKLEYKKKLKAILNDLECQSFQDVLKKNIRKNIDEQSLTFAESNQIYDEIFQLQTQIKTLQEKIDRKRAVQSHFNSPQKLKIQAHINEFQAETQQTRAQITKFKEQLQNVLQNLLGNVSQRTESEAVFCKESNKILADQTLTFTENHQVLKNMMAFFNDQLFENWMLGLRRGNQLRSKLGLERSMIKRKNHKLSSISFDKKVRVLRTEADNPNSSLSIKDEQFLDSVLNMHLNGNDRIQRGDKADNLSIMTEEELLENSRRLIKQIKKKKSEFISINPVKKSI